VAFFIKDNIQFKIREDISVFIPHTFESLFIEIVTPEGGKAIVGVIYRPNTAPRADLDIFTSTILDIMNIINTERKHGIIMGDMNVDLLKYDTHTKTNDYLESIFSFGFSPVITLPTRLASSSATLIDHIYTNRTQSTNSGIVITDVADHFGVFHITKRKKPSESAVNKQARYFSQNNCEKFRTYLEKTNFDPVLHIQCPNEAYNIFIQLYLTAFDKSFPLRNVKSNKKIIKKEPWMTTGLLTSSRTKAKFLMKKLNKPTEHNISQYRIYNNKFNQIKRSMKIQYYNTLLEENKYNIKKSWSILKVAIGKRNDKSSLPEEFKINNNSVTDRSIIANNFNEYFANIGPKTYQSIPISEAKFTDYLPAPLSKSMFLDPVDMFKVVETTNKLKTKTSSGYDEISTKLLKETIHNISKPLTHIINQSFQTGIIPTKMKIAKVVPVHKSSDPSLLTNYRPISLLTAFSKLLEKLMYDKVIKFLTSNNIFYEHQYGFRPKHSTIHPIIHLLNKCAESNNKKKKELTLAVFCDLSKAFDVISHKILLHKLNNYGLRGIINTSFQNYLTDRTQYVEIEGSRSTSRQLQCGVPQGSILGPLLYLIYVNDISKSSNSHILSFADDTTMYVSDPDVNLLYKKAETEVNNLFNWFCANKLSLNSTKTKYIVIRPNTKQLNLNRYQLKINGTPLSRVGNNCKETAIKFLGIYIDECLTWKKHLAHVNTKIARAIYSIKQLKHVFPCNNLRTLYFALIHPHISYGILAWGKASPTILKKTEILQKRAVRMINKKAYNSHTDPLYKSSEILKITDLYEHQVNLFMYDFYHKLLPISFHSVFKYNHEIQSRPTRQSHLFNIERCQSAFSSNLPLYTFPIISNKYSKSVRNTISRSLYKEQIKNHFIKKYNSTITCTNK
jgi:hypothetical protein